MRNLCPPKQTCHAPQNLCPSLPRSGSVQPDAGPNDEERCQPSVPMRASLARSSSSVSFAFGAVCTPAGRPRGVGGARGFLTPPGADFFSWLLAVARLGWPPAATSPAVAESSEIVAGGDSRQ